MDGPAVLKSLWAIDLDRTLIDGDRPDSVFTDICAANGIEERRIAAAKEDIESRGGSFDVIEYLGSVGVPRNKIDVLCDIFINTVMRDDIFLPGASAFLGSLKEAGAPYLILTYGGTLWQLAKLRAMGLDDGPFLITDTKSKGELIAGWKHGKGYALATTNGHQLAADSIWLVDDKASSFYGLPADCSGYLVRWQGKALLKSQEGSAPENVSVIPSLESLTGLLDI